MDINGVLMKFNEFLITHIFLIRYWLVVKRPSLRLVSRKHKVDWDIERKNEIFIVLNGPSLKTQDLSVLKGKDVVFVNRGFLHPFYKVLKPKFHVFADCKILNGIWPLSWLDEIFALSPETKVVFPIEWYYKPNLKPYRNDSRILWLDYNIPYISTGVSAYCFSLAIKVGYDNIYFTGFDANSLAYDMIKSSESHFYGSDPELKSMTTSQHRLALFSTFIQFSTLISFAKYCERKRINIINLTNGGVLDVFPREELCNVTERH